MCNVRKGKSKVIVPNNTMQKWKEAWSSPEFKAKSHQFTANRCSEIGGVGAVISRHTEGSVSHATNADRMETQLGRRPFLYELFHKTHTRKGTYDMVDARVQSIKDAFLALKEQSSQPQEGCSDPPAVDEVALYYQVVGGKKKNRVYGIGSQASIFYPSSSYGSSSTTSHHAQLEAMDEEIKQLHQTIGTQFTAPAPDATHQDDSREADSSDE
ncbi:uncharacterized protein LOC131174080 [Hevea brasiliensis]|uniref:uncharacterized protein LOC131174080 n=1 Tax=Hevea brasiliensis TaxID=3981 RepID=UPI0025E5C0A9|nr:uncharacterized protein LOC131174080 [Hevea brasiliensis]